MALSATNRWEKLELEHFDAATVVIPVGASRSRPVVIAIHGQSDSPESDCEAWSTITEQSYFILCPSLRPKSSSSRERSSATCADVECLASEIREALISLRKRFGKYVARREVILAGYETGASKVVPIALQNPKVFSILWLVNGGLKEWSSALSTNYVDRGGKVLGVVCAEASCKDELARVVASAHAAGLKVAPVHAEQPSALFDTSMVEAVRLSWLRAKPKGWPWKTPYMAKSTTPDHVAK